MSNMKDIKLTKEEKKIIDSISRGEWRTVDNFEKEKIRFAEIAKKVMKKKSISIRLSENDLQNVKIRALEEGVPYQTLIASIVHKYASGKDFA